MPIFEFRCVECGEVSEKLFMGSEERVKITCPNPNCNSQTLDRVVSRTNHQIMGGGSTGPGRQGAGVATKQCGSGNECTTLELPGHTR
jgi:putative FmdB family regulatory protein